MENRKNALPAHLHYKKKKKKKKCYREIIADENLDLQEGKKNRDSKCMF